MINVKKDDMKHLYGIGDVRAIGMGLLAVAQAIDNIADAIKERSLFIPLNQETEDD